MAGLEPIAHLWWANGKFLGAAPAEAAGVPPTLCDAEIQELMGVCVCEVWGGEIPNTAPPKRGCVRFVLGLWSAFPAQPLPSFCSEHACAFLMAAGGRLGMGDTSPSGASLCPCHYPWTLACLDFFLMVFSSRIAQVLGLARAQGMDEGAGTQVKTGCAPQQQPSS